MASSSTQQSAAHSEVMAAMEAWRQATVHKDIPALERLLHPDLTYSHSNCRNESKADVLDNVGSGKSSVVDIAFGESTVRVYGDAAVVKGDVEFHNTNGTVPLNVLYAWVKGPEGWQMVARQATRRPE